MTVDVATLQFEFVSDSALVAEKRMDALIEKGAQLEAVQKRVAKASDVVAQGHKMASGAAEQAARGASALAAAEDAAQKASSGAAKASADVRAQRQLEAAAMRELVQSANQLEREQTRLQAQAAALKASYDPLGAAIDRVNKEMAQTQALAARGVISDAEAARAKEALGARLVSLQQTQTKVAAGARLTANESLNLSRQFADIGVSIASGMPLWMVAIQQGSQIQDVFAQASTRGVAFKTALAGIAEELGLLAAAAAPVLAIVGPIAIMAAAMAKGREESEAFARTMKATGDAAGITGDQFQSMVDDLGHIDGFGKAREALIAVAASGKVMGDQVETLGALSLELSKLTGESAEKIAGEWANMGQDVAAFAAKHNAQYHLITEAQYEHIKLLQDEGKTAQAQAELIAAATAALAQRGQADLGVLQKAWKGIGDTIGAAWENLKKFGAGGDQGIQNQITLLDQKIAAIGPSHLRQGEVDDLKQQRDALQGLLTLHQKYAEQQAREGAAQQAGIDAAQRHAQTYASMGDNLARVNAELKKYRDDQEAIRRVNPNSPELDSPARAAQIEADIRKKYTESQRSRQDQSASAIDAALKDQQAAQVALTADVELQAQIKHAQVATELKSHEDMLARQVKEGSITASAAKIADGYYQQAADLKNQLIEIQKRFALEEQALAQRQAVSAYQDREAQAREALAGTADAQNKLEMDALNRRQKLEADELDERLRKQVALGQITEANKKEREAALAAAQAAEKDAAAWNEHVRSINAAAANAEALLDAQAATLKAQQSLSKSAYGQAVIAEKLLPIEQQIALIEAQRAVDTAKIGSDERAQAELRLQALKVTQQAEKELAARDTRLINAVQEAADAMGDFKSAVAQHDWARAFAYLEQAIDTTTRAFQKQGVAGGVATAGSALSSLFPQNTALGKVGSAIGLGAGVSGLISGLPGMAATLLPGLADSGALMSGLMSFANLAGPIGLIAGAASLIASFFGGGKPSNFTAAATFGDDGSLSYGGDKPNDNTMKMIQTVGQTVQQGQDALKSLGLTLGTTIKEIAIGQRDTSKIHLSDGTTIETAAGDTTAAMEAAMKAVLQGATYTNDAEKKMVDSMIAAGKGFDDISAAIQTFKANYDAAQQIQGSIADQILQLTDPEAYDRKQVTDAIKADRDAAQQAADAGYLTADQLTAINAQLDTLQGLQLDQVLAKYAKAVDDGAQGQADAASALASAADQARSNLIDAYNAEVSALNDQISTYKNLSTSLHGFLDNLKAAANPQQSLARAQAAFLAVAGKRDTDSLAKIPTLAQAYVDAATASARTSLEAARVQGQVRSAVEEAATYADAQVSIAQQQLDQLQAMGQQLGIIAAATQSFAQAAAIYQQAQAQSDMVKDPQWGLAKNIDINKQLAAATGYTGTFGTGGWEAFITTASPEVRDRARAILDAYGESGRMMGFATGGSITPMGPSTGDQIPMTWMMNGGETAYVSRKDVMERVAGAIERQNALLERQNALIERQGKSVEDGNKLMRKVSLGGTSIRTTAAA